MTWFLRRTAEGIHVVEHGGEWPGQNSWFLFVPEHDFALTVLTNSESTRLPHELAFDDWALQRFAGLRNHPAVPTRVSPARLAEYEGAYVSRTLLFSGEWLETAYSMRASDGALRAQHALAGGVEELELAFYRGEYVVVVGDQPGPPGNSRANFVRGVDGRVAWFSSHGRLYARRD